ncbi:MAG: hypothetical protein KGY78_12055 [Anaerolineae bacterium]|nr:hypothetical protein [Anaerolineae bacterium]
MTDKAKPSLDEVTRRYVALRQRKAEMEKAHKEALKPLNDAMEKLENYMQKKLDELGADSVKTPHGTPYKSMQESITVADRDTWLQYLRESDAWELADIRASKTSIRQHMKEYDGELPPGLNYRAMTKVNVRS